MKKILFILIFITNISLFAQNTIVKVDFETSSFKNIDKLPHSNPFIVEGEVFADVELVEVSIFQEKGKKPLNSYVWNRNSKNQSETFTILIPEYLKSNSRYDFNITTFRLMSEKEKNNLKDNLARRIIFYLRNQYSFDGKNVELNNSKAVFSGLEVLIFDAIHYQRSKNGIEFKGLSKVVKDELDNQSGFKFRRLLRKTKGMERDSISNQLINRKISHLTELIMSEVMPFLNSQLVQQKNDVAIKSVPTEKEPFTLPVNGGLYVWNTNTNINNVSVNNTSITPGIGFSIPFKRDLRIKNKALDSFALSFGVLTSPISDATGTDLVTPTVNLPVYAGLGIRFFDVIRLNVASLIVAEQGISNVNNLQFFPTIGLTFELNLWMGVKK